jgi:hypothetical protein
VLSLYYEFATRKFPKQAAIPAQLLESVGISDTTGQPYAKYMDNLENLNTFINKLNRAIAEGTMPAEWYYAIYGLGFLAFVGFIISAAVAATSGGGSAIIGVVICFILFGVFIMIPPCLARKYHEILAQNIEQIIADENKLAKTRGYFW